MTAVTEHDRLIAEYSALEENLPPEVLAVRDHVERMRAAGQVAPPSDSRDDNHMIGLDDDFRPFPVV